MALDLPVAPRTQAVAPPAAPLAAVTSAAAARRPRELPWLVGVGLLLLALCAAPYVVADRFGPPTLDRIGTFWFVRDFSQYQAAMREGSQSTSWLIHDHFTAEPHQPILMYPLYVGLGKLAALGHLDHLAVFTAAEWLGRLTLFASLYVFIATFTREVRERRLAMLLAIGTLGLAGWALPLRLLLEQLGQPALEALLPEKVNVYLEISSFGTFLSAPHLMLGLALTLLAAPVYLRAKAHGGRSLAVLGLLVLTLSLVHPFNLPVLATVLLADGALAAWQSIRGNQAGQATEAQGALTRPPFTVNSQPQQQSALPVRVPFVPGGVPFVVSLSEPENASPERVPFMVSLSEPENASPERVPFMVSLSNHARESRAGQMRQVMRTLLPGAIAAAAAAPMALYNLALFQLDPFWSGTYGVQNLMPAPAPWALPVDFGLVLLGAPFSWHVVRGWPAAHRRLLLLWIGLGLLWLYAPVPYQRRFAFGLQPALAVLSGVGLLAVNRWMRARQWGPLRRRAVNYGLALGALATSVLVYISLLISAATDKPSETYLWSRAEAHAAAWLSTHSDASDVVMAATPFANPLVGVIDGRVVHGHIVATRDSATKEALVARFYAADTPPIERAALLDHSQATVVGLGPRERALGATPRVLAAVPGLQLVYDQDGVQWYRRTGSSAPA